EDEFRNVELLGGLMRSPQHFHTPLLPWDRSGLDLPLLPRFESSIRWAQSPDQGFTGRSAWKDARAALSRAATGNTEEGRQQAYADTFRILGQLMHLVVDMASVAHTRNDSHLPGDDFETFMAVRTNESLITGFKGFDPRILQAPTGDPVAMIPVARIWDTDRYDGTNPPGETGSAGFGLAEISSAN